MHRNSCEILCHVVTNNTAYVRTAPIHLFLAITTLMVIYYKLVLGESSVSWCIFSHHSVTGCLLATLVSLIKYSDKSNVKGRGLLYLTGQGAVVPRDGKSKLQEFGAAVQCAYS